MPRAEGRRRWALRPRVQGILGHVSDSSCGSDVQRKPQASRQEGKSSLREIVIPAKTPWDAALCQTATLCRSDISCVKGISEEQTTTETKYRQPVAQSTSSDQWRRSRLIRQYPYPVNHDSISRTFVQQHYIFSITSSQRKTFDVKDKGAVCRYLPIGFAAVSQLGWYRDSTFAADGNALHAYFPTFDDLSFPERELEWRSFFVRCMGCQ